MMNPEYEQEEYDTDEEEMMESQSMHAINAQNERQQLNQLSHHPNLSRAAPHHAGHVDMTLTSTTGVPLMPPSHVVCDGQSHEAHAAPKRPGRH